MSGNGPKNIAASVHARLKNVGRATKRDFNLLLIRYALERFLYRIRCDSENPGVSDACAQGYRWRQECQQILGR